MASTGRYSALLKEGQLISFVVAAIVPSVPAVIVSTIAWGARTSPVVKSYTVVTIVALAGDSSTGSTLNSSFSQLVNTTVVKATAANANLAPIPLKKLFFFISIKLKI